MASLNRLDYEYLFALGSKLYTGDITPKEAGTILMAMSEYVIGPQYPWPSIQAKHRHLTSYKKGRE